MSLTTHHPSPPMLTPSLPLGSSSCCRKEQGGLPNICRLPPPLSQSRAPDTPGVARETCGDLACLTGGRALGPCAGLEPGLWLGPDSRPELDNQSRKEPQRGLGGAVAPQAADNSRLSPTDPPSCSRAFCPSPETAVFQGQAGLTGEQPSEQDPGRALPSCPL